MKLPLRQKIPLGLIIITGVFTIMMYNLKIIDTEILKKITLIYSASVPIWLLSQDTLVDLNNNRIFFVWFIIGLINFAIYLFVKKMGFAWGGALRSFLFFFVAYKILNSIMKKVKGRCLLNTYLQMTWKYDGIGEKITALDIVFIFMLLVVIILSVFWN